jgi:signal transduction histidine kinase
VTASPRSQIIAYLVAAVVLTASVWAIARWSVETESERRFQLSEDSARQLAVFFERQTVSIFHYGDAYLKMIRRDYARDFTHDRLKSVMSDVPLDTNVASHITIIDSDGTPVFNSGYPINPDVNVSDRDYFAYHRDRLDAEKDRLYVSLPHRGRNSGKLVVRLVRRISRPDGGFAGVIFTAVDASSITEFFLAMNLGENSSATLVGLDKRIRARSSYGRLGPGQDISGSRIWKELEQAPQGNYLQTSVVDDITRNYAYRRLQEFPLIVAIGVAMEDVSGQVSLYRTPAYLLAALATVLFVAVTALMSRQVMANERIRASESQLRAMHDELERRVDERTAELVSVQEELIRADRLAVLGQLTGTVAHELRNPLSTIDTSLTVLENRLNSTGDDLTRLIERIHRNVQRCNNIITDLLDFARVDRVDPEPMALDPWLAEALAELNPPEGVELRFIPGAGDAVIMLDPDRLRRSVINLVDNAGEAISGSGESGGEILVSTRIQGSAAYIEIADNGPGIHSEHMSRIHEPLYSTKSFGIGLGLSIVEQIMTAHGGTFDLDSTQGEGTRARLSLPLREA